VVSICCHFKTATDLAIAGFVVVLTWRHFFDLSPNPGSRAYFNQGIFYMPHNHNACLRFSHPKNLPTPPGFEPATLGY